MTEIQTACYADAVPTIVTRGDLANAHHEGELG